MKYSPSYNTVLMWPILAHNSGLLPTGPKLSCAQILSLLGSTLSATNFPPEIFSLIQGLGQCLLLHKTKDLPFHSPLPKSPMGLLDISDFCDHCQMHVFLPHKVAK